MRFDNQDPLSFDRSASLAAQPQSAWKKSPPGKPFPGVDISSDDEDYLLPVSVPELFDEEAVWPDGANCGPF